MKNQSRTYKKLRIIMVENGEETGQTKNFKNSSKAGLKSQTRHREHTILWGRKRANKGMKRMNSLPLRTTLQGEPLLTSPVCNTVALNSNLGLLELCKMFFGLCIT